MNTNMKLLYLAASLSIGMQTIDARLTHLKTKLTLTKNHIKAMYYIIKEQVAQNYIHNNLLAKLPYCYGQIKLTKFIGETSVLHSINIGDLGIKEDEYKEIYLEKEDMCIQGHKNMLNVITLQNIEWQKIFDTLHRRKTYSNKIEQLIHENDVLKNKTSKVQ